MAKSITIQSSHTFTTGRGETETVEQALAWVEKHMGGEDEDGESTGPSYTPADLIVYAVRRLRALHKDGKRFASGKLAARLYAPRLAEGMTVPKKLVEAVGSIDEVQEKLDEATKPAPKKETKKPAAKPAPKKETKPAAKPAKTVPTARPPTVRKAAAKHDAGGAVVEF
jgi:hypothetical protein